MDKKENKNNFAYSQIFETEEECKRNPFVFVKATPKDKIPPKKEEI
jgi:hypothetical protein